MIDRGEILTKAEELDLHPSNVQRDYVFGWLLSGLFRGDSANAPIALKGGNGLRTGIAVPVFHRPECGSSVTAVTGHTHPVRTPRKTQ